MSKLIKRGSSPLSRKFNYNWVSQNAKKQKSRIQIFLVADCD